MNLPNSIAVFLSLHLLPVALVQALAAQAPVVRDSAGVRIIENRARLTAPVVFTLGSTPVMEVGGTERDATNQFDFNQGYLRGVRLSDGTLVVIDVNRVHFFDERSTRFKIADRRGTNGAPEFLYLSAICRTHGDTVLVSDDHFRRIGVLDRAGTIVRSLPQGDMRNASFNFCFGDGSFLLEQRVGEPSAPGRKARLTRLKLDGSATSVLGEFPAPSVDFVTQNERAIAAFGELLYYGDGTVSELRVFDTTGRLLRIIRTDDAPVAITDADVERRLISTIPLNVTPTDRDARLQRMRAMPHASTWPAYARIHVDPLGRLWMQDYRSTYPAPDWWTAFDDTGRLLGRLLIPIPSDGGRPFEVVGFGKNEILVRRIDSTRISYLTVYPILPASAVRKP